MTLADSPDPAPSTDVLDTAFGVASVLIGVGLCLAGIAVVRARVWTGWHRFITLACGVAVFVMVIPGILRRFPRRPHRADRVGADARRPGWGVYVESRHPDRSLTQATAWHGSGTSLVRGDRSVDDRPQPRGRTGAPVTRCGAPLVATRLGFVAGYWTRDPETGRAHITVVWESERAARNFKELLDEHRRHTASTLWRRIPVSHSHTFIAGLAVSVVLALADVLGLAAISAADAPPAVIVIVGAALGLITLVGVWTAWRHQRGGRATVIVSRLLSLVLGVPVYFTDGAPSWAKVVVTIGIVPRDRDPGRTSRRAPVRTPSQPPRRLYYCARYILISMTKRLIDIDDELLLAAQAALGAGTFKETVRSALEQVISSRGRTGTPTSSLLTDFAAATRDLSDPEVMDAAWR